MGISRRKGQASNSSRDSGGSGNQGRERLRLEASTAGVELPTRVSPQSRLYGVLYRVRGIVEQRDSLSSKPENSYVASAQTVTITRISNSIFTMYLLSSST